MVLKNLIFLFLQALCVVAFIKPRFPMQIGAKVMSDGSIETLNFNEYKNITVCYFGRNYIVTEGSYGGCYDTEFWTNTEQVEWSYNYTLDFRNQTYNFVSRSLKGNSPLKVFIKNGPLKHLEYELVERWPYPLQYEEVKDLFNSLQVNCQSYQGREIFVSYTRMNYTMNQKAIPLCSKCQTNTNVDFVYKNPTWVSAPLGLNRERGVICSKSMQRCDHRGELSYLSTDTCYIMPERKNKVKYIPLTTNNATNFEIFSKGLPSDVKKEPTMVGITDETWISGAVTNFRWQDIQTLEKKKKRKRKRRFLIAMIIAIILELIALGMAVWLRTQLKGLKRASQTVFKIDQNNKDKIAAQLNKLINSHNLEASLAALLETRTIEDVFDYTRNSHERRAIYNLLRNIESQLDHAEVFLLKMARLNSISFSYYNETEAKEEIEALGQFFQKAYQGRTTMMIHYTTYNITLPHTLNETWWVATGTKVEKLLFPIIELTTCGFFIPDDPRKVIGYIRPNFWENIKALKNLGYEEGETLHFVNGFCDNEIRINVPEFYQKRYSEFPGLIKVPYVPLCRVQLENASKIFDDNYHGTGDWSFLTKPMTSLVKGAADLTEFTQKAAHAVRNVNPLQLLQLGITNIVMLVLSGCAVSLTWGLNFYIFKLVMKRQAVLSGMRAARREMVP